MEIKCLTFNTGVVKGWSLLEPDRGETFRLEINCRNPEVTLLSCGAVGFSMGNRGNSDSRRSAGYYSSKWKRQLTIEVTLSIKTDNVVITSMGLCFKIDRFFFSIQIKRKKIKFAASTLQKSDLKLDLDQIFIISYLLYIAVYETCFIIPWPLFVDVNL